MHRKLLLLLFAISAGLLSAQEQKKPYFIRITLDKVRLGNDSVKFKSPKTLYIETAGKTDTIEVATVKGTPIAMTVEIRKYLSGKTVRYQIGYAFYKKENSKWTLIKHFGFIDRFSLLKKPEEVKKGKTPKPAHEEFFCSIGEPMQFSAGFRMDVYLNQ
ncbi:MAG TPA: hypothetical protein VK826_03015 [Bacteroidia bacterium]|nr:hypothetical protein [Bacteroidia bacterium]